MSTDNVPPPPPVPHEPAPQAAPGPGTAVPEPSKKKGCFFYGCLTSVVLLAVILLTVLITVWWVKRQFNPEPIESVVLTQKEEETLQLKIETLQKVRPSEREPPGDPGGPGSKVITSKDEDRPSLDNQPLDRTIELTEKEINAMLGHNTDFEGKVYVRLDEDLISAIVNIPMEEDVPFVGGKTIRAGLKLEVVLDDRDLDLVIKQFSIAGIPIPNAWMKEAKNVDLVEHLDDEGMKALVDGIEYLKVEDGKLTLRVAE